QHRTARDVHPLPDHHPALRGEAHSGDRQVDRKGNPGIQEGDARRGGGDQSAREDGAAPDPGARGAEEERLGGRTPPLYVQNGASAAAHSSRRLRSSTPNASGRSPSTSSNPTTLPRSGSRTGTTIFDRSTAGAAVPLHARTAISSGVTS